MTDLDWLPRHPALSDAITKARALPCADNRLREAVRLAGFQRDSLATMRLDKLSEAALREGATADDLQRRRLAILGSATVDHLIPAVRIAALTRRLVLDVTAASYGQYRQVILDTASPLDAAPPDFVLLALDETAVLPPVPIAATEDEAATAVQTAIDGLTVLWRRARARFGSVVLQQTVLNTRLPLFGSFDALVPGAPGALIDRLNRAIAQAARAEGVLVLDIDRMASLSGRSSWYDPVRWHQAKQAVGPVVSPLYGDLVARVIAAACGLSRKCLVLDLDNTLWGGVIGDDGIDGIVLGQGSAAGEAYLSFQVYVAALAERGIVLALCSKNDLDVVEAVFKDHPEMHLKRERIAAVAVNWKDKASNLRELAQTLDLGLDSFVFADDNPAEREIVRRELPMVAVPELPDDVAHYAAMIARAGYFESVAFTTEDRARAEQYVQNARRKEVLSTATDMDGFLSSLEMTLEARAPGSGELIRVTQLINKSNQFNLTTRRYTAEEIERAAKDPNVLIRSFRLVDKFGDNGLIAVIIARPCTHNANALAVDTWLMSCRVLGRGVEQACLGVLAKAAADRGAEVLIGEYRPTARNGMVRDHYKRLGFAEDGAEADAIRWRLDLKQFSAPETYIRIVE
jgi:FkbH-like protein